jgi:hypothetical protein
VARRDAVPSVAQCDAAAAAANLDVVISVVPSVAQRAAAANLDVVVSVARRDGAAVPSVAQPAAASRRHVVCGRGEVEVR